MAQNKQLLKFCLSAHSINLLIQIVIFFPILFFVIYLFVTPFQQCPISKCGIYLQDECEELDDDDYCVKRHYVQYLDISLTVNNVTISSNFERYNEGMYEKYGCVNESYLKKQYFHDCYYYDNGLFEVSFGFQPKVDAFAVGISSAILGIELIFSLIMIGIIWLFCFDLN